MRSRRVSASSRRSGNFQYRVFSESTYAGSTLPAGGAAATDDCR